MSIWYLGDVPVEGVEGVQKDKEQPVDTSIAISYDWKAMTYQSRKRPASLMPMDFGSVPRCSALRTMTGKALEYFRALARCCLHDFVSLLFMLVPQKGPHTRPSLCLRSYWDYF